MILLFMGVSIIFLGYFLTGVFYIIKKPKIIINRKLNKTQKVYNITNVTNYFNSLGKLNLYMSFLFYLPFIIAFYSDMTDMHKYSFVGDTFVPMAYFYILYNIFEKRFKRKIKRYLVDKSFETIDSIHWLNSYSS